VAGFSWLSCKIKAMRTFGFRRRNGFLGQPRWLSSGLLFRFVWKKFTDVSEVLAAYIFRVIMEVASTSKTSVKFYQTAQRNYKEDGHLIVAGVRT
jgi:hypothetical protein